MYQINWIGNWHSQMNLRLFSLRGKRLHAVAQIVVRSPTANSRVYLSAGHTNAFEAGVIFCTFLPRKGRLRRLLALVAMTGSIKTSFGERSKTSAGNRTSRGFISRQIMSWPKSP